MKNRLTHRGRRTYNTASNQKKIRITPGNKRVYIPKKKTGVAPKCEVCAGVLHGIATCRPSKLGRIRKSQRTVSRIYAGKLCGDCLSSRIIEKFLIEEEKKIDEKI